MTILIINNYFDESDCWKAQAIVDRLKGLGKHDCKILHHEKISKKTIRPNLEAIILSGSLGYLSKKEDCQKFKTEIDLVSDLDIPVLGICFGHHVIGKAFGSEIKRDKRVKGFKKVEVIDKDDIFAHVKNGQKIDLLQNHRENVESIPADFSELAKSKTCKIEAMKHNTRPIYGVQAHVERANGKNPDGLRVLQNFLSNVVDKAEARLTMSQIEEEEFKKRVEESEQKYGISDCIYSNCIQEISNLGLDKLGEDHEIRIFRPFLFTWGKMGRVLGEEGVSAICGRIRSLSHRIEPLRKANLLSVNLFDSRDHIVELFNCFCTTEFKSKKGRIRKVCPTASSKILHLTCPDFFVMWDSAIRKKYGKSKCDGKEYFEFLLTMQTLMLRFETTINYLKEKYGRKATRIIDQFNWMSTHE
jgi:GMP synthase (glutamine-hydrolysing)